MGNMKPTPDYKQFSLPYNVTIFYRVTRTPLSQVTRHALHISIRTKISLSTPAIAPTSAVTGDRFRFTLLWNIDAIHS